MLIARLIADQSKWETQRDEMDSALPKGVGRIHAIGRAIAPAQLRPDSLVKLPISPTVLEMQFPFDDAGLAHKIIKTHFAPTDFLYSDERIMVPSLFISDMDSTMIGQECIDELADYAGIKPQIAAITERAMQGELDFESALRERVALLQGLDESAIDRCLAERIAPTPGAKTLVSTLKSLGCRCVLVTGGFHHFGDRVAEWLGFDRVVGNRLEVADGKLTGKLAGPISDASTKLAALRQEAEHLPVGATILASGDGANDIPMLEAAHYGFAYRAKPKARSAANGRVDSEDLTAILSLLGIDRKDWVED
ncbi:phosphoserine phosphatase SerB [Erythrobacter sp. NAP1]|uniref:phosphoserine phosphatase SerB n=1 Tax=Erythrobacter sp. NAP1 TaxID=237727 RepID=UPI00032125ED